MRNQRSFSLKFKRRVVEELLSGEILSYCHSRVFLRVWVDPYYQIALGELS